MKFAIDAMGGDYAPVEVVKGAMEAAIEFSSDTFYLVGDETKIWKVFDGKRFSNITVIHTDEYIRMDESPSTALKLKKRSSMSLAAELIKSGECDAMISAGNTGALLEVSLFSIGRIRGIKRPALAVLMPTRKNLCLLLDAGANADCKPEFLVQFARMGSIYMEKVAGIKSPRVGLVNIGEEEGKGNQFYRQVYDLMKDEKGINFVGNTESRALFAGNIDVAVADGFVGNIVLKSAEAAAELMNSIMREEIKKSIVAKMAALTLKPIFRTLRKRLDHSEHGGALLLGLKGILVKSHGRADARTIYNAVRLGKKMFEQNVLQSIADTVSIVV